MISIKFEKIMDNMDNVDNMDDMDDMDNMDNMDIRNSYPIHDRGFMY